MNRCDALAVEHLRIMRADIADFRTAVSAELVDMKHANTEGFGGIRRRLTHVEHSIPGLKRDEVDAATGITGHRQTLDTLHSIIGQLRERLDTRLDTLEARAAH